MSGCVHFRTPEKAPRFQTTDNVSHSGVQTHGTTNPKSGFSQFSKIPPIGNVIALIFLVTILGSLDRRDPHRLLGFAGARDDLVRWPADDLPRQLLSNFNIK